MFSSVMVRMLCVCLARSGIGLATLRHFLGLSWSKLSVGMSQRERAILPFFLIFDSFS